MNAQSSQAPSLPGFLDRISGIQWVSILFLGWLVQIVPEILPELLQSPMSVVQDDARHHVVWLRRLADPALFSNDPIADFFLSQSPLAYRILYAPAFWFNIDVLTWHLAFLAPLTCLVSTIAIYRFTTHILPTPLQRGLVTLALCTLLTAAFVQGLQRNFSIAVILFAWSAYLERRIFWIGLIFLFGANIYPVAAAVAGTGIAVHLLLPFGSALVFDRRAVLTVAVAGMAAIVGLIPFLLASADAGPTILAAEARNLPIMNGGRSSFFKESFWNVAFCHSIGSGSYIPICIKVNGEAPFLTLGVFLSTVGLGWFTYRYYLLGRGESANQYAQSTLKIALSAVISGSILFTLAHLFAFRFYLPDRYTGPTIGIIFWLSIAMACCAALIQLSSILRALNPTFGRIATIILLAVFLYTFVTREKIGLESDREPELSAFLRQLPSSTVVAGFERYADSIPAFGLRSTYTSIELILPYKINYYNKMRDRVLGLREAILSEDPKTLAEYAARENITHYVTRPGGIPASHLWNSSFPGHSELEGRKIPTGALPDGTECLVAEGRRLVLIDALCLGGTDSANSS